MKYVGLGVLAIAYWVNVVLLHMLLIDSCRWPEHTATLEVPATEVAPAARAVGEPGGKPTIEVPGRHLGEVDPLGGSEFGPMSKAALVAGLNDVRPRVHECYVRHQVPGTAMVSVSIAKSGRVATATVTGKFAGTPTGACVERAVKTARFPVSDGFSTPYPFQLK